MNLLNKTFFTISYFFHLKSKLYPPKHLKNIRLYKAKNVPALWTGVKIGFQLKRKWWCLTRTTGANGIRIQERGRSTGMEKATQSRILKSVIFTKYTFRCLNWYDRLRMQQAWGKYRLHTSKNLPESLRRKLTIVIKSVLHNKYYRIWTKLMWFRQRCSGRLFF
jgi:hypothetical protein